MLDMEDANGSRKASSDNEDSSAAPEDKEVVGAPEDKVQQETKRSDKEVIVLRRRCDQLTKEKETVSSELNKTTGIKVKLEALCRELQKQNKQILEDSKRVAAEEQQKRQDLSKKFHNTIKEITAKLEEQGEERMKQFRENEMLREKLKNFAEQYEIREQHFAHQLRTKDLEQQLLEAKFRQQLEIAAQESIKAQAYQEQVATLSKTEQELRNQLSLYGEKFEQFQDTLTKSNEVFTTFKREMEKMSKTIKKLEKENGSLKTKCEKSDVTLIEMLDERTNNRKQIDTLKSQKEKLESLCRTLQTERLGNRDELERLRGLLKEHNIPIPESKATETNRRQIDNQVESTLSNTDKSAAAS